MAFSRSGLQTKSPRGNYQAYLSGHQRILFLLSISRKRQLNLTLSCFCLRQALIFFSPFFRPALSLFSKYSHAAFPFFFSLRAQTRSPQFWPQEFFSCLLYN